MTTFGFIGSGNMSAALAIALAKTIPGDQISFYNPHPEKAERLAEEVHGIIKDNLEIARHADYLFLGVKPQMLDAVAHEIGEEIRKREGEIILISMLAGTPLKKIADCFGEKTKCIRIMPNTPVSVSKGIILYHPNEYVSAEEVSVFTHAMQAAGYLYPIAEEKIDAATSVTGCGPAFVDLFVEALADAAVSIGIPRSDALQYAAAMVAGSAQLLLETGKHPGVLKDEVCSPAGTTIQGVRTLEKNGFRSAVFEAVLATYEKNNSLK